MFDPKTIVVAGMNRRQLILWLENNDRNGVYNDYDHMREFGRVATNAELIENYNTQMEG